MTAIPQPGSSRMMSDRIVKPLRDVSARQWNVLAAAGVLKTLVVALSLLLVTAVLLGTFAALPVPMRVALAGVAWVAVVAVAAHFLRPALRRRTVADAAFTVERRTPGLHERLSSTVELSTETDPFAGSPALLRHLARQAEADAAAVRPDRVVPADEVRRWALLLAPVLLLWLGLAVLFPRPILGGLYRTLMPWRAHLPAILTRIAVSPGDVTLAEGDSLEIKATVNVESGPEAPTKSALLLTAPLNSADEHPLARDLQNIAPRQFRLALDNLRQSFRYRVTTGRGDSPWFTATVLPRPAVAALDVRYDYPAYARIDPKTVPNADGNLRALQGTDVTLTLHASESLDVPAGKSRITVTEGGRQRTLDLRAVEGQANVYETKLTVFNSGSYRIQLFNRHGLANRDDQPRTITAEMDQPPRIAITAPQSQVTVRPDDDVPVAFNASDDFGVAKVVAMVQVDDKPAEAHDVAVPATVDRRQFDGQYLLSVAAHLERAGTGDDAKTITYWLKATDNRDPDPQTVESARQTLKIDKYQQLAYRARLEQEQARDLMQAIDKAIQRLNESEGQVNSLKSIDANRAMNADERRRADEQRDKLAGTGKDLGEAAESNLRTSFREAAEKARQIAEGPIEKAAESVGKSRLNAEQAEPRSKAAAQAVEQIADARKQLEELKKSVDARAKQVQSDRELEKLAERQTDLANQQAKAGPKPKDAVQDAQAKPAWQQAQQKFQQRQRELLDRLNRVIGQDESLRDPKAAEQAAKLRELLDHIEQIQKDEAPLQEQVARQEQVAALQDKAEGLAERQQKLNQDIEAFSENRRAPLQKAEAKTPERWQQAAIVDRLRKGEVEPAREMQKQSAEQLKQAAQRLQERGRSNELKPDPVQQNALNLQEQAKQQAQQAADQAKQAAQQLQQAKAANNPEQSAQAQKKAEEAAQAVSKQAEAAEASVAEAMNSDDATAKKNGEDVKSAADAAEAAADAAREAAQQGNAEQAAQELAEAGKQLVAARQKAAEAVKADMVDDQRDASNAAAEQAKDLAKRQKELADAAKENGEALANARRDQQSPQDVANRQSQLKDQTKQAKQQADQLEQLAKPNNLSLAERAAVAEKLLEDAAVAEADAAQGEQAAGQAQQQADQLLQQAGQAGQQAAQLDQQAEQASQQAEAHEQQAEVAQQNSAKDQAEREKQQAAQDRQRAQALEKEASAADQRAAQAVKQADAAQDSGASARKQAAEKQAAAQDALAKAEAALRDIDRMAADESGIGHKHKSTSAKGESAEAQTAADAQASAQEPDGSGDAEGQSAPAPLTPEQAMRQAAQGAQEAAQAQQQSLNNAGDPGNATEASQEAAAALQEAAAAMAAATASAPATSTDSVATTPEEQAPSQGLGKGEKVASRPGRELDSRHGIGVSAGGTDDRPVSVQQLGISAGDWARLGPLTQQELLNAAQQNGPPAYREMIKNYYVRIARLERDGARPAPATPTPRDKRNANKK